MSTIDLHELAEATRKLRNFLPGNGMEHANISALTNEACRRLNLGARIQLDLRSERDDALAKASDLAEQLGSATLAAGMSDNLPKADTLAKTIKAADELVRILSEHCEPQVVQAAMAEALASVEPIDFDDALMGPEAHPDQTASAVFGGGE